MLFQGIFARLRNFNVLVEIDPLLLPQLDTPDKVTTPRIVLINLRKLIYLTGSIQSRRLGKSNRMKFLDKSDLLDHIDNSTNELRIRISVIRGQLSAEDLTSISGDFGVGLSAAIISKLFNINEATITRIFANGRRPDWQCQTADNRLIIVESKGSCQTTSNAQRPNAIQQKNTRNADIKIASLTAIKENEITTTTLIAPPLLYPIE